MRPVAIARLGFTRLFRDRSNIFFIFVFPMALILLLGAAFGGSATPKVGVLAAGDGTQTRALLRALGEQDVFDVQRVDDEDALFGAVERGRLAAAVVIPARFDEDLAAGRTGVVRFAARADQALLRIAVDAAVEQRAAVLRAAGFAQSEVGVDRDRGVAMAESAARVIEPVGVDVVTVGEALFPEDLGRFDIGASTQLVLFVFLMSLMGGVALIESRQLGVTRRMLSTPTAARQIILGDGVGRFAIAMMQGLFIMVGSLVIFQVDWGDPAGAVVLLAALSLVGAGGGMLMGATLRTEQQALAVGLMLGLGMGALGGSMVPSELFSDTVRTISHVTPHAWANDGYAELVRRDGGLADIANETAILLGYAAVLLALASWRLRRVLTKTA